MTEISEIEINEMEMLSNKIDKDTAILDDFKRYEELLIKAGFEQSRIRARMNQYGFFSYEEYVEAKSKVTTREQRKIFKVIITSSLVVLFAVVLFWIASGIITKKSKTS